MQEGKEMELDITYFLCEVLATSKIAYKHIDKLYSQNKEKYLKLARNHKYYKIELDGTIEQEFYFKKALGIILDDDVKNTSWLLKMTYKKSNQLVKNSNIVNLSDFLKQNNPKSFKNNEIDGFLLAILVLAQLEGKEINFHDALYQDFCNSLLVRNEYLAKDYPILYKNISKEDKKELKGIELKFKNIYPEFNFNGFTYAILEEGKIMLEKMTEEQIFNVSFEYIYDLEDIALTSLIDNELKDKEIQELICCWNLTHKEMDYKELYKFLGPALQIRYLLKAYKEAKRYCFSNLNEDLKELIEKKESELSRVKKENNDLKQENARLKKQLDEEIKKLVEENTRLEKKNNHLLESIKNQPDVEDELHQLRNLMFNLSTSEDAASNNNEVDIDKLNNLNAICFGGTNNWINTMKEVLPNWTFIAAGVENFDVALLKGKNYIFINTKVNSHGMYYKVIENKDKNSKIRYINTTNRDRILREIEKEIEQ